MSYLKRWTRAEIKENSTYLKKMFGRFPVEEELEYYCKNKIPKKLVPETMSRKRLDKHWIVPKCKREGCRFKVKPETHRKYCSPECLTLNQFEMAKMRQKQPK